MNWKKILIGKLSWKRFASSIIIIYIIMNIFVSLYAEQLIFPYHQSSYNNKLTGLKIIKSKDDTNIATRFWQAENEKHLILYFHGNYLDLGHLDEIADILNDNKFSVLAMDYRGYGLSQGNVTENNTYQDSQLLLEEAINMGYSTGNIIILGRSIGSGIATELALNNETKALILISPFTSTYRVMTNVAILPFDKFNNLAKISKIEEPLFIIHGSEDQIILPWHSEELLNQHKGPKQRHLIETAGHNDIWQHDLDDIFTQFFQFLE